MSKLYVDEIKPKSANIVTMNNAFGFIYLGSHLSLTNNTLTKITGWTSDGLTEMSLTDNKLIPNIAGHYWINFQVGVYSSGNDIRDIIPRVYKNGSVNFGGYSFITVTPADVDARHFTFSVSNIVSLAASDELEFYVTVQTGGTAPLLHAGDSTAGYRGNNVSIWRVSD